MSIVTNTVRLLVYLPQHTAR